MTNNKLFHHYIEEVKNFTIKKYDVIIMRIDDFYKDIELIEASYKSLGETLPQYIVVGNHNVGTIDKPCYLEVIANIDEIHDIRMRIEILKEK